MIRVLGRQTSGNVQKVLFGLEEMGVPYAREDYGRQFGNTQTPDYLAMNPNAKVPTVIDGDLVIWESHTILRYLAALNAPGLHGASPAERTHVERWMDWLLASMNTLYVTVFKDSKKDPGERAAGFDAAGKDLAAQMVIADRYIADRPWFAGDAFSLADIAMGPIMARCLGFPIDKPDMPNLARWIGDLEQRPAFQVAVGKRDSTLAHPGAAAQ
jgi:glutathione S-transferase